MYMSLNTFLKMAIRDFIQSNDCVFQVDLGAGYATVLCGKSFGVTLNTDEKEITTENDGRYKDFDYKVLSFTLNINSALEIQDDVNPVIFDFVYYQNSFLPVTFRLLYYKGEEVKVIRGVAIVKSSNLMASASQLTDGSVELLGKGTLILEDSLPNNINLNLIMTGQDDAVALAKFRLNNTDGDTIFQSDTLPEASGGWLSNPFNITASVPKGEYYIFWTVQSDVDGNNLTVDATPGYTHDFDGGTQSDNTYPAQLYDFNSNRTATFTLGIPVPPPDCVTPSVTPMNNTTGTTGVFFAGNIIISGTQPFSFSDVTKPDWLTMSLIDGYILTFSGMPPAAGTYDISGTISNGCGEVDFSETVTITDPDTPQYLSWDYNIEPGAGGVFRLYRNGILVNGPYTSENTGIFLVNVGDSIQVTLTGSILYGKRIQVSNAVDGSIYDSTSSTTTKTYTFSIVAGKGDYNLIGTIEAT